MMSRLPQTHRVAGATVLRWLLAMLFINAWANASQVTLNEIVSSNASTVADEDGNYEDWIELHNSGETPVDLSGWGLTDAPATPFKWVFPDGCIIGADQYLLVWTSNKDRRDPAAPLHTNFAVSASGETIVLTQTGGTIIEDSVAVPALPRDASYGRKPGGDSAWYYFEQPTPGAANATPGYSTWMTPPECSQPAGFYPAGFDLNITANPAHTVYYTLDGSDPDPARVGPGAEPYRETHEFTGPLQVGSRSGDPNVVSMIPTTGLIYPWLPQWQAPSGEVFKATVVRAVAHDPETGRLSPVVTRSFFVDPEIATRYGQLPVISLVTDHRHLFAEETGIYVPGNHGGVMANQNFFQGWVKPASIEYFEGGGTPGFSGVYEISIQGSTSPASMQKGLNVIARDSLGPAMIEQSLFPNSETVAGQLASFKRFMLRSWGSARSWEVFFADAYHQMLAASTGLEIQDYRPAVVFINGEYWGLHEMREANKNSWYHQARTGIDRDDPGYDLIDGDSTVDEGDAIHWSETMAFINANNMANDAAYDYITTRIDVENFAQYIIHCVFCGKRDWPDQNEAKWRPRTPDGRWRWSQYDMDQGLSEWGKPEYDMLYQTLSGPVDGYGPHPLLVKLIQNSRFRKLFINTYADWLNTRFETAVALARFDAMKAQLDPFISEFNQRWPNTYNWSTGTSYGRNIVARRKNLRIAQLAANFNLGSTYPVTLKADSQRGLIRCNTFVLDAGTPGANAAQPYPWTGTYFQNQPLDLTALPRDGYRFAGWKVWVNGSLLAPVGGDPSVYSRLEAVSLELGGSTVVEALFEPLSAEQSPFPIHVWNFANTSTPLVVSSTVGGGVMTVTPASNAEGRPAEQGFSTSHLRINNPLGVTVQWAMPTTNYSSIKLDFLTRRDRRGAGSQTLSYTLDGTTWKQFATYSVFNDNPQAKHFDFSKIPGADYNPRFALRLQFSRADGDTAGSNRFDQVVLTGMANVAPVATGQLQNLSVVAQSTPVDLDLADYFVDYNGDPFAFTAQSSSPALGVSLNGPLLRLSGLSAGEALVTVTAQSLGYAALQQSFRVLIQPTPSDLAAGGFRFGAWSSQQAAGTYPPHMLFVQSEMNDPVRDTPLLRAYHIPLADASLPIDADFPYAANARTRINGLGENGISFINTGRGRDLGAAILALDTTGRDQIRVKWKAGTITPNERVYALSLQCRLGHDGPWTDFTDSSGNPIQYIRHAEPHGQSFGPLPLPAALQNQPYVQLQWRYHHLSGTSGARAELGLDDIAVYDASSYQGWAIASFTAAEAADPARSGPLADYAGDGVPNLVKYALGLSPGAPVTPDHWSVTSAINGAMTARFRLDRSLDDVVYQIQVSGDLADWSAVVYDSAADPGPNNSGSHQEVVLPATGAPKRFLRLAVIRR
jgi:hypothetical protein